MYPYTRWRDWDDHEEWSQKHKEEDHSFHGDSTSTAFFLLLFFFFSKFCVYLYILKRRGVLLFFSVLISVCVCDFNKLSALGAVMNFVVYSHFATTFPRHLKQKESVNCQLCCVIATVHMWQCNTLEITKKHS